MSFGVTPPAVQSRSLLEEVLELLVRNMQSMCPPSSLKPSVLESVSDSVIGEACEDVGRSGSRPGPVECRQAGNRPVLGLVLMGQELEPQTTAKIQEDVKDTESPSHSVGGRRPGIFGRSLSVMRKHRAEGKPARVVVVVRRQMVGRERVVGEVIERVR